MQEPHYNYRVIEVGGVDPDAPWWYEGEPLSLAQILAKIEKERAQSEKIIGIVRSGYCTYEILLESESN